MTALLVLSPSIFDHSFPRNDPELQRVSDALGQIEAEIEKETCLVLITDFMAECFSLFDWQNARNYGLLNDIYRLLSALILRQDASSIRVEVADIPCSRVHPAPQTAADSDVSARWQDEIGRLLSEHIRVFSEEEWCVGVACELAFSGQQLGTYRPPFEPPCFPLVGPRELHGLVSAFRWGVAINDIRTPISFSDAYKNISVLGGKVHKPSGGSHHRVSFPGARSWVLDPNNDPVPDAYLAQLPDICAYPINVVKWALLNGRLPPKELMFARIKV